MLFSFSLSFFCVSISFMIAITELTLASDLNCKLLTKSFHSIYISLIVSFIFSNSLVTTFPFQFAVLAAGENFLLPELEIPK